MDCSAPREVARKPSSSVLKARVFLFYFLPQSLMNVSPPWMRHIKTAETAHAAINRMPRTADTAPITEFCI